MSTPPMFSSARLQTDPVWAFSKRATNHELFEYSYEYVSSFFSLYLQNFIRASLYPKGYDII